MSVVNPPEDVRLGDPFAGAAPVAAELARLRFGSDASDADPPGAEGNPHPVVGAARVAARLRPQRPGTLARWERELLEELLS